MKRVADGVYRNTESGVYFERPWIDGRRTWRSLETENLKLAKEELHRRKAGVRQNGHNALLVGQIIQRYQKDGYPDAQRLPRPARMHSLEEKNCQNLLSFWARVKVADVSLAVCDRYHDWRCERIQRGLGHRAVDLDLNTLSNAFIWGARCEMVQANPISSRPRYCAEQHVAHCRNFMPTDADHLHTIAGRLFARPRGAVLGFQLLVEALSGIRTTEALQLRADAKSYEPGWITPDGKSLFVHRAKKQEAVNPFVNVHPALRAVLDALFAWKKKKYSKSPWFFPCARNEGQKHVGETALAHALPTVSRDRKVRPHGLRAFYVTVRRSHGKSDVEIAYEIGHTTGGSTIASVYGGCPPEWLTGGGPKMSWLPTGKPAWENLSQPEEPQGQAQNIVAPGACLPQAEAA